MRRSIIILHGLQQFWEVFFGKFQNFQNCSGTILFKVKHKLKKEYSFNLPSKIKRIDVGAKSSLSKTNFHIDSNIKTDWTILGFLNPVWNTKDGGEFFLENEKITYKGGRFIVFPSCVKHDGGYVINEKLSYWRIAVNIILSQPKND